MRHWHLCCLVAGVATGCAGSGGAPVSAQQGEIGIFLGNAPNGVNCINFKLENEDGNTSNTAFALPGNFEVIHNLTVGAYNLSAVAYFAALGSEPSPVSAADCAAVPADAQWSTEAAVPVVIELGMRTSVNLTLLPVGSALVGVSWFEPPVVIAQNQGRVEAMVAASSFGRTVVAWAVGGNGFTGEVHELIDQPGALPFTIGTNQLNLSEMAIDPDTDAIFWENMVSGTTDADGLLIADGSIVSSSGTGGTTVVAAGQNPGDLGIAVANHTPYWVSEPANAGIAAPIPFDIACAPCAQPLATGQVGANGLTAHGDRVYWGNLDGSLQGMSITDALPTQLASIAPETAYGATADDQFAYFIANGPADPLNSDIIRVPALGGPPVVLATVPGFAFPIAVFHGFLYFSDGVGVHRVSSVSVTGGFEENVVSGAIGGFAVTTDATGHDVLYWSDTTHGGLIWRGRL